MHHLLARVREFDWVCTYLVLFGIADVANVFIGQCSVFSWVLSGFCAPFRLLPIGPPVEFEVRLAPGANTAGGEE